MSFYTPTPIAPFSRFTSSYVNSEHSKIAAAIDAAARTGTIQTGSFQFGGDVPGYSVVLDVSNISSDPGGYYVATLPSSPSVGDPPFTLSLYAATRNAMTDGTITYPVIIAGHGSDPINGSTAVCCYLLAIGESITLRWVGGELGWIIVSSNLSMHTATKLHSSIATLMTGRTYVFSGGGSLGTYATIPRYPGAFFNIALNTDTSLSIGGSTDHFKSIYGSSGGVDTTGAFSIPHDGGMYHFSCSDGTGTIGHWLVSK